jgi:hypothetical protein
MIVYVDIDDTICETRGTDYASAVPIARAIDKVNSMYDEGHTIVYWTARGSLTGIDWRELTESQLKKWGARYTELKLGKPAYDIFIDDKNINSRDWLQS